MVYGAILAVSAVPGGTLAGTPAGLSVAGHLGEYALLGGLLHRAMGGRGNALAVVALVAVAGTANEAQQALVPGRVPDVADLGVDLLGALVGVLVSGAGTRPPGPGSPPRRAAARPAGARGWRR